MLTRKQRESRRVALKIMWLYYGTWYRWGGDDPTGFDCSGLAREYCLSGGMPLPNPRGDSTAHQMYEFYNERGLMTDAPAKGRLAFYMKDNGRVVHVEVCLNKHLSIGASGGGPHVLTPADAIKYNAYIKVRSIKRPGRHVIYADPLKGV